MHIRPAVAVLLSVLTLPFSAHSFGASLDGLIAVLGEPSGWRALGSTTPGTEDGFTHDLYANSAVIAAVLKSQGVDAPFVKLSNDPATAWSAFNEYLQRTAGSTRSVSDETCGIAVAHLYGQTLSQLLLSKGPQWVMPQIGASEAGALAEQATVSFGESRSLALAMCDSWKYRKLNNAFAALLNRVSGEMPYLLHTALPQGKRAEEQKNAQQAQAEAVTNAAEQSGQLGHEMLQALQGVSPAITEDPFTRCIGLNTQSGFDLKNQCLNSVLTAAEQNYQKILQGQIQAIDYERANALRLQEQQSNHDAHQTCSQHLEGADNSSGFSHGDNERFARCRYVQLKLREDAMIKSPPQSNERLAADELARATALAERYPAPAAWPAQEREQYLKLLRHAVQLGNTQAKLQLATFMAQDMNDMSALTEAEKLLDDAERAQGATQQSQALRNRIAPVLQAWRFANSPEQKRKTLRAAALNSTDDAVKMALSIDQTAREGGTCDALVINGYNIANNAGLPINTRLQVLIDKITDALARVGCFY